MENPYPNLFRPIVVNGKHFRNRILSAPIGAWVFSPENYLFDYAIDLYADRAKGGAASVLVGHTEVMTGTDEAEDFGLYFDLNRRPQGSAALAEFAAAVRQHGAHVGVQLNHSGMNIHGKPGGTYYGPSGRPRDDGRQVLEMPKEHIAYTISRYVGCVKRLQEAGFDMAMIHGGHGWLVNQFLSPDFNRRSDEYGGCFENRCRFGVELLTAIREAVGKDFIVEYRISGADPVADPEGFAEQVAYLNRLEGLIDIVNVSSGSPRAASDHTFPSYLDPQGTNLELSAPLKKHIGTAVAVVGNIATPEFAERVLAEGKADFISMARALTADPELPRKARAGHPEDIRPCIGCYSCLETMHHSHFYACDVNPRLGREHRIDPPQKAEQPKKVVVVGGGVGGMEAALTADRCGHRVVLLEQSGALGGLLKLTDGDPVKYKLHSLKDYYLAQLAKSGVEVRLNTAATEALIAAEAPDALLLAAGSEPIRPNLPGAGRTNVYTCVTAHAPGAQLGERVVIVGGNMVGVELAFSLRAQGKDVTVVEMTARLHADANGIIGHTLDLSIASRGVRTLTGARCTEINERGVVVATAEGTRELPADSVVFAVGMRARRELADLLYDKAPYFAEIGDCVRPGTVRNAIRQGHFSALDI